MSKDRRRALPVKVQMWITQGHHPNVALDKYRASRIRKAERCERCSGTGNELYFMYGRCRKCKGTGLAKEKA